METVQTLAWFAVALSLLLPWLAGALLLRRLWPDKSPGSWPLVLGYGYWLALFVGAMLLYPLSILGLRVAFWVLMLGFALVLGWTLRGLHPSGREVFQSFRSVWARDARELGARLLFALLLGWIGLRFAVLALEVWWQPLYPWDAWTTWAVRARVWSELGRLVPFVAPEVWAGEGTGAVYTIEAWNYPALVSYLALWPTLAAGGWNETAANLPWLGAAMALALGFYGQARLWTDSAPASLAALWGLISLPLLDTHVALAGYADLWLAGALGLSLMAFMQWTRTGDRRQAALCLALAATWPLLKLEGAAWLVLLVPAWMLVQVRRPWISLSLIAAAVLGLGLAWLIGLRLELPIIGLIEISAEAIQLPLIGRLELGYHDTWAAFARTFWGLENWHLLGYLLLIGLIVAIGRVVRGERAPWLVSGLALVLGSLLLLWGLFFLTDAHRWAEQGTSLGRLLLHFVPFYVFFLLTLWGRASSTST
ncbi:hypothetical protein [Thermochromatium tepidum]|uniref:Glycosyltransferase RgtA/B/C/D-like domain-containing protein n=1 Tax=Thermochromatium tepidum ATCC 43061 TaxID=316276 RepID=A0A6I6EAS9_THETI|nr:hypothetical protein [Thermochromatium tepidum]QGU33813.1 hypothetical protein E6P07_13005 [Thermochromatium tepidum ATCC 43061]